MGRTSEKPKAFFCSICGNGYIHASNLSAHMSKKHAEEQEIRKVERNLVKCNPKKKVPKPTLDLDKIFTDMTYCQEYFKTLEEDDVIEELLLKEKTSDILGLVYAEQLSCRDGKITYLRNDNLVTEDLTDDLCYKMISLVGSHILYKYSSNISIDVDDKEVIRKYLSIKYDYLREKKSQITNITRAALPSLFYATFA